MPASFHRARLQGFCFYPPQIRLFSPDKGTVSRVPRGRLLQQGDVILFPKSALGDVQRASSLTSHQSGAGAREKRQRGPRSVAASSLQSLQRPPGSLPAEDGRGTGPAARAGPALAGARRLILEHSEDIIFVNKPAGIDVQGPSADSIEALMAGPLKLSPSDDLK